MLDLVKQLLGINPQITLSTEGERLYQQLESTTANFFVTGNAGTGKSTLINYFRAHTQKKVVVLAPTGLAAINVGGQTIHSFFHFPPRFLDRANVQQIETKNRIYRHVDTIVIDEASMVRADVLDGIDIFLRKHGRDKNQPFGGHQLILVGDLFQLPPVLTSAEQAVFNQLYETPYFFSSQVYRLAAFTTLQLTTIFRQADEHFIKLLNAVRLGQVTMSTLSPLRQQVRKPINGVLRSDAVTLTTTNAVAHAINRLQLDHLALPEKTYQAHMEGTFPVSETALPVEPELRLRRGARVMFVKNGEKWVNGSLGQVQALTDHEVKVKLDETGEIVSVEPAEWEHIKYQYNNERQTVEALVLGSLKQIPLRLAWAITIHKSQGMTFDKVNVDFSRSPFAHGQTYVALSRCRTLQGLSLSKAIYPNDIIVDPRVVEFLQHSL